MTKSMLIDATQKEETRVAVIDNGYLEDFDYENALRKPLKGNIYLAKVTRVEPSLQAAFVNYGGNRHGFLSFSEIHPDYFKIPVADREALLAEHEEAMRMDEERAAREAEEDKAREAAEHAEAEDAEDLADVADLDDEDLEASELNDHEDEDLEDESEQTDMAAEDSEAGEEDEGTEEGGDNHRRHSRNRRRGRGGRGRAANNRPVERYEDAETKFRMTLRRRYKIQEVIKRGQIMLIQVNKEERGNKGAAVSSYLSLPGRYCVLMPNSPRGGGVSRKISNYKDRNRMREIMKELEVPKGMSVILRTAGVSRTKTEIKRDLDYLVRLWNNIRELTLESTAPALVYEEADLVKRAVRDFYTRDVDEIVVAGDEGFKTARNFMKMLIPSHVRRVKEYKDEEFPLFAKYNIEHHIAEIGETQVKLPSGGYLVINPTEALVSIDVNSGKSTKERHIEETALRTNLEAAVEVARQLRLRDLGGLVVIDFIDMENRRNNAKVERKMRDALSKDRARVQVGRISNFGLMELSRQRMSASLTESQFESCAHCAGAGRVRTPGSAAVMVLRGIAQEGQKNRAEEIIVSVPTAVVVYILNHKRAQMAELEEKFGFKIIVRTDDTMTSGFTVEVSKPKDRKNGKDSEAGQDKVPPHKDKPRRYDRSENKGEDEEGDDEDDPSSDAEEEDVKSESKPKRRRRRNRRSSENRQSSESKSEQVENQSAGADKGQAEQAKEENPKDSKDSSSEKKKDDAPADKAKESVKSSDETKDAGGEDDKGKAKKPASKSGRSRSKKPDVSNDDAPKDEGNVQPIKAETKKAEPVDRDYETVNELPGEKKKGWWNKLKS